MTCRPGMSRQWTVLAVLTSILVAAPVYAIQCKVTVVGPVNFGVYMPMTPDPVDIVGQLTVRCQAQPGSFSISIGPGISGDQTARTMSAGGPNLLFYNLYRDAARTEIWGNGAPPTFVVSGVRSERGRPTFFDYPIYGRIYASQAPNSGVYIDNLLVTVLF